MSRSVFHESAKHRLLSDSELQLKRRQSSELQHVVEDVQSGAFRRLGPYLETPRLQHLHERRICREPGGTCVSQELGTDRNALI